MDSDFIVRFRGFPVLFKNLTGARVMYEITTVARATGFITESEAWQAVKDYSINPKNCTVKLRREL